jgi:hypothetical protein
MKLLPQLCDTMAGQPGFARKGCRSQADRGGPTNAAPANLVCSVRASDVQTVICNGRVLMRDRELLTLDVEEITARVGESMNRLSRRVPSSRIQLYRS